MSEYFIYCFFGALSLLISLPKYTHNYCFFFQHNFLFSFQLFSSVVSSKQTTKLELKTALSVYKPKRCMIFLQICSFTISHIYKYNVVIFMVYLFVCSGFFSSFRLLVSSTFDKMLWIFVESQSYKCSRMCTL